jgi:hypothetical protein
VAWQAGGGDVPTAYKYSNDGGRDREGLIKKLKIKIQR